MGRRTGRGRRGERLTERGAARLLALGQVQIDQYPTAAVEYALKSLEISDGREGRLFAQRALQRGPTAIVVPGPPEAPDAGLAPLTTTFSPDGEWLAVGGLRKLQLFPRGGGRPVPGAGEGFQGGIGSTIFIDRQRLLCGVYRKGFVLFDLRDGSSRFLPAPPEEGISAASHRGRFVLYSGHIPGPWVAVLSFGSTSKAVRLRTSAHTAQSSTTWPWTRRSGSSPRRARTER